MRDNFSPDILMSILIEEFNFADIEIPDWSDPDEIRKQVRLLTHRQQLRDLRIKIIDVIGVLSELARQEYRNLHEKRIQFRD